MGIVPGEQIPRRAPRPDASECSRWRERDRSQPAPRRSNSPGNSVVQRGKCALLIVPNPAERAADRSRPMEPREENPSPPETGSPSGSDPRPVDADGLAGAREQGSERTVAGRQEKRALPGWLTPLIAFWVKINNDWIFNRAGLLAYNFLMTVFPILLVLLAVAGVIVGNLSPSTEQAFEQWIAAGFPGETGTASSTSRMGDRKSTRLNSSHQIISYAVFCLKKKT